MKLHFSSCLLMVVLLQGSAALAQNAVGPQFVPSGMEMSQTGPTPLPPVPSPAGQPVYQPPPPSPAPAVSTPPPGQSTWPPPAEPVLQPTAPYAPPGPPVYQPAYQPTYQPTYQPATPYAVDPGQPVFPPPASWMSGSSPGLGLVPGATNPHWDISIDALWLERDTGKGIPLGFTSYNPASHAFQAVRSDSLWTDDVLFPLEPGIRLQLVGRITDQMAIEATCWGLQDWSVGRTIYGDPIGETVLAHSTWLQTPNFDNTLGYTYGSQVANVELNQRFKLYTFDPYRAFTWLWGVRYFHLNDDLTLNGSDLYSGANETLNWQTKNDLVGMQVGVNWTCGADRFQLSTEAKVGLFANIYSQHGLDTAYGAAGFQPIESSHGNTDLAALFEFSVMVRYRIASCMWLRAGYQYYGVSGLALGPRQLGGFDAGGNIGLDGLSLGVELTR